MMNESNDIPILDRDHFHQHNKIRALDLKDHFLAGYNQLTKVMATFSSEYLQGME